MYLMKASAKYNGINGLRHRHRLHQRYVLWDTATDRLPDDEVLFVFVTRAATTSSTTFPN